jgi:hypothetical protein
MNNETCPPVIGYVSPFMRDQDDCNDKAKNLILTPWSVQNICYELIANFMLSNDPSDRGYIFTQRYDRDPRKTGIFLDIAYNHNDSVIQKRPAIFIGRGAAEFKFPTMNQQIGGNSIESQKLKMAIVEMPVQATIVASNVGFVEQLAEYLSRAYIEFAEQIRDDFFLRLFKLDSITSPTLYLESKDSFTITLNLLTSFDMGFTITRDDLKLKTMSFTVFTSCAESPLLNQ